MEKQKSMSNKIFHHREPGSRIRNAFRQKRFRVKRFKSREKDIKVFHLLPNVLTSFNVAFGVSSIILGVSGKFELAAICILVAAFFDMIDGKVARLVGASSQFGVQLDSLADVISFGVAPPMLVHSMIYTDFDRLGLSMVVVYSVFTAMRLARYNVKAAENINKKRDSFMGLPCPVPACFIAAGILVALDFSLQNGNGVAIPVTLDLFGYHLAVTDKLARGVIHAVMVILSILMVSTIPYPDLTARYIEKKHVFQHNVIMVLILGVILLIAKVSILVLSGAFILLGPLQLFRHPAAILTEEETPVSNEKAEPLQTPKVEKP